MEETLPKCPKCKSEYTYQDGLLYVCPNCAHEWSQSESDLTENSNTTVSKVFKDAYGNVLVDGDSVTVIKDLRIGGSSEFVKQGTKVKSIRLIESDNGHDIDCKISGFGAMQLKSEYVKKAT